MTTYGHEGGGAFNEHQREYLRENAVKATARVEEFESKTIAEICEEVERLGRGALQLGKIRATLIVNCREDQSLGKLGCKYDESKSVLVNLISIIERLILNIAADAKEGGT